MQGSTLQPANAEVTVKDTWHAILEAADEHDAALIVLGARGLNFKSAVSAPSRTASSSMPTAPC